MSSEAFRQSLTMRGNGINFLEFLVLSEATRLLTLVRILWYRLFSKEYFNTRWRIAALGRFMVLYVVLFAAQFVWLYQIKPTTTYRLIGKNETVAVTPGFGIGVGDFSLIETHPLPFAGLTIWN